MAVTFLRLTRKLFHCEGLTKAQGVHSNKSFQRAQTEKNIHDIWIKERNDSF